MYATGSPTSTPDGETLQDLLNALTKPPKWMVETSTPPGVTDSSVFNNSRTPKGEPTWRNGVGTHSRWNQTLNSTTWSLTAGNTIVTGTPTSTDGEVETRTINNATEFWYKYGISITVAVLVIVVVVVLIIQCRMVHQKRLRTRRLVDLIQSGKVKRTDKAREQIFESFHRRATNDSVAAMLNTAPTAQQEEIPMRHLAHHHDAPHRPMAPVTGRGMMMEPLARVYPLRFEPVCPRDAIKNANLTDPYPYDNRRLWNTTAGLYPIRAHRSVLSEPAIARPSSRRYSSRNRIKRIPTRGDYRLPKFNLSGKRIVTSPETNAFLRMRNREVRHHSHNMAYAEPSASTLLMDLNTPTPKLVVPTNTPNTHCTDSAGDNASPHGPGLDSDFGASAGIPHFTVSPDDSMNCDEDTVSVRDASYEWDTYDPAYMNRTVSYVDGAYFPVLHRKQYWV
ncbi:uncharacterized protein LOC117297896 [Asterias rubens]|uniref:uncharacterized protein LOC117297896 n=1 Tax=Asterias rubens TaxID=7604 RepID=UPI0014557D4C|nr:uncharacterized protein LOC117297896 [Asterias rubens]